MLTEPTILVYEQLSFTAIASLRHLFDAEYMKDFGEWDPKQPYGYSPLDVHVVAYVGPIAVGHVGFQRRLISIASRDVMVGGTGGVLVAEEARGSGLGRRLMARAQEVMRSPAAVDFGYLGCRDEVVDFYAACGWTRIRAKERFLDRVDRRPVVEPAGAPIMICPAKQTLDEWPTGAVDLRGAPW